MATDPSIGQERALRASVASMGRSLDAKREELCELRAIDPGSAAVARLVDEINDQETIRIRLMLEITFGPDVEEVATETAIVVDEDLDADEDRVSTAAASEAPGPPTTSTDRPDLSRVNHVSAEGVPLAHGTLFDDVDGG